MPTTLSSLMIVGLSMLSLLVQSANTQCDNHVATQDKTDVKINKIYFPVTPAKAPKGDYAPGVHKYQSLNWIPACAGMTPMRILQLSQDKAYLYEALLSLAHTSQDTQENLTGLTLASTAPETDSLNAVVADTLLRSQDQGKGKGIWSSLLVPLGFTLAVGGVLWLLFTQRGN